MIRFVHLLWSANAKDHTCKKFLILSLAQSSVELSGKLSYRALESELFDLEEDNIFS